MNVFPASDLAGIHAAVLEGSLSRFCRFTTIVPLTRGIAE